MTRINAGISVKFLTDEHLLAEHREIKRLSYCLDKAIKSGSINNIPDKFTLGKGNVLFFLDKMKYTLKRYVEIYDEAIRRGFDVQCYKDNWKDVCNEYMNAYEAHDSDRNSVIKRITERINNSRKKSWHYYGKSINKSEAIKLLYE